MPRADCVEEQIEEGICSECVWRRHVLKRDFFGRDNFVRRIVDSEIKAVNNFWIRYVLEDFYCRPMLMRMNSSFSKELFDEALR